MYACSVWGPHLKTDINKIEMVQQSAARYIIYRQRNTSSVACWCHVTTSEMAQLEDPRRDVLLL
jgi:hypothetical protein